MRTFNRSKTTHILPRSSPFPLSIVTHIFCASVVVRATMCLPPYGTVVSLNFSSVVDVFLGVSCSSPMAHFFVSSRGDKSTVCGIFVCYYWGNFLKCVMLNISHKRKGDANCWMVWGGVYTNVCVFWLNKCHDQPQHNNKLLRRTYEYNKPNMIS